MALEVEDFVVAFLNQIRDLPADLKSACFEGLLSREIRPVA